MIYFKDLGNYGRLGNQLFQIAATVSLALENNDEAIFPEWKYNKYFKIGIRTNDFFDIKSQYHQVDFHYNKIPYFNGMNLNGYFQSEKYFFDFKKKIREIFELKDEFYLKIKNKWNDILKENNVTSLHIRRGDYVEKKEFHYIQPMEYYSESINYIDSIEKIDKILIFSDDIKWCKEIFKEDRFIFVENQEDIDDLFLMSMCKNNIVTNSSFSWWGSWLNENENKIVCAPSIWFGKNGYKNWKDIYYEKMKIIL